MKRILVILAIAGLAFAEPKVKSVSLPDIKPKILVAYATLDTLAKNETSGIVKSRKYKDLFWVHNDSGDKTRIYPIHANGEMYKSHRYQQKTGTAIPDAVNFDWEDITNDDKGNIIIGDVGNNCQCRHDLLFYLINEPDPSQEQTIVKKRIFFKYPDQTQFPAPKNDINFDCEGVFYANGKIHLLSKNRNNTYTKLYRLDQEEPFVVNDLTLLDKFDIGGKVTAADASKDGKKLLVLTYASVWIFTAKEQGKWFEGAITWLPFKAEQTEGACFDGSGNILISDEKGGKLYRVPEKDLIVVRK